MKKDTMEYVLKDHGDKLDRILKILEGNGKGGLISRVSSLEWRWGSIRWTAIIGIPAVLGLYAFIVTYVI